MDENSITDSFLVAVVNVSKFWLAQAHTPSPRCKLLCLHESFHYSEEIAAMFFSL